MSDDCGCCTTPPVASEIENRPGLTAIAYRTGTFATVRQRIIDQLAHTGPLSKLTARGPDDYTTTTIELWSAVADVLSFYEERIANEAFLRTAGVRDSVVRLVRLIGYELAPGVAATTWLAFTVERGKTATVPAQTRVKSVPATSTDTPVTFETMDELDADAAWNALQPYRASVHTFSAGDTFADFAGVATGLAPGDVLVFVGKNKRANWKSQQWDTARVRTVAPNPATQRTHVTWAPALGASGRPVPSDAHVFVLRQRASVFGHNAPDWHMIADAGKQQLLGLPAPGDVTADDRREWPQFEIYAPLDPNKPRERGSPGLLTIQPTIDDVVAAALAAAADARQAVLTETATAGVKAVAAIGNAASAASIASKNLLTLLIKDGAAQVSTAIGDFAGLQNTIISIQNDANSIANDLNSLGQALGSLPPDLISAGNDVISLVATSGSIQTSSNNLPADLLGTALKSLGDLLQTFKKVSDDGHFGDANPPSNSAAGMIAAAIQASTDAIAAVKDASDRAAQPVGALAAEKVLQAVLKTAVDNQDALAISLPLLTAPQRVAVAAVMAVSFVEIGLDPAAGFPTAIKNATGDQPPSDVSIITAAATGALTIAVSGFVSAAIVTGAGVAMAGLLTAGGVGTLFIALFAGAALWPVIFTAMLGAAVLGALAFPGADRVAKAVVAAVMAALKPKHPAAPLRYLPRHLSHVRIDLDSVYPRIVNGGWLLLSSPARTELYQIREGQQTSRTDFALTGAVTRLRIEGNGLKPISPGHSAYNLRETAVLAQSEEVPVALDTSTTPFNGPTLAVAGLVTGNVGRQLLITGIDNTTKQPASDLVTLKSASAGSNDGTNVAHTDLVLDPPVDRYYSLDGLVVYGNVVYATQGETVRNEVLGDGDASQVFQHFALKKKPVTFAPDEHTQLVQSSLSVMVSSLLWKAVPTLFGASSTDPVYTARIADDKTLTVTFGNGVTGSRLPTGRQNVVARYRQGIGAAGNLDPGRLATLIDRPQGLRGATNPIAAAGGVEPESLDGARDVAPGTVRTFGRAVSRGDFEDSTLTAGIVAKATAAWVWTGEQRVIHLTVGAADGKPLPQVKLDALQTMFLAERDPNHVLVVDNYQPMAILVSATITVDDRHGRDAVLAAARAALLDALSFAKRRFAQPVYLSELFAVLQDVDGVLFVDVDTLDLKTRDASVRAAHGIDGTLGQPQPRLLMLPARPDLASRTLLPAELAVVEVDADVTVNAVGGVTS